MINKYLTCERYLKSYNQGEKTVVANLDCPEHISVTEVDTYYHNASGWGVPTKRNNFLVGPIADALHAYEELGYTPEELKKIIEEYKKLKERSLFITTRYGIWNGPSEEKFRVMKEALERGNRIATLIEDDIYDDPVIKLLHPGKKVADGLRASVTVIDEMHTAKPTPACKTVCRSPESRVERVIFNDPATIVFWSDGTKTVVKCSKEDIYDPEKGLAMAFAKKMFGNDNAFHKHFKKWLPKEEPSTVDIKVDSFAERLKASIVDGISGIFGHGNTEGEKNE